jgi:hypothetical protein
LSPHHFFADLRALSRPFALAHSSRRETPHGAHPLQPVKSCKLQTPKTPEV